MAVPGARFNHLKGIQFLPFVLLSVLQQVKAVQVSYKKVSQSLKLVCIVYFEYTLSIL